MIIFKKVRYKNFLSTGQQFIEINLNEAPTTLVVGNNGAGKSTIVGALLAKYPQLAFSVSACSRPPRGQEQDGIDYYFLAPACSAACILGETLL